MNEFKMFFESEEEKNIHFLISLLPSSHKRLLKRFKFVYTPKNTLAGDKDHIGYIYKKKIVVAAPWNYSRKFTTLHEIAHLVWEHLIKKEQRKKWSEIVRKTKNKQSQNNEELFCMAYACYYSGEHCPRIHDHKEWNKFISSLK